jgi:hypothetical protein
MQGDAAAGTISTQFAEEEPTSQLLVNVATDGLISVSELLQFSHMNAKDSMESPTSSTSGVKEAVRTH